MADIEIGAVTAKFVADVQGFLADVGRILDVLAQTGRQAIATGQQVAQGSQQSEEAIESVDEALEKQIDLFGTSKTQMSLFFAEVGRGTKAADLAFTSFGQGSAKSVDALNEKIRTLTNVSDEVAARVTDEMGKVELAFRDLGGHSDLEFQKMRDSARESFDAISQSALTTADDQARAANLYQAALDQIDAKAKESVVIQSDLETAFKTMGVESSASIEEARDRITEAYELIMQSTVATIEEQSRATDSYQESMKQLDEAASAGGESSEAAAGSVDKLAAALTAAGINLNIFKQAWEMLQTPIGAVTGLITAVATVVWKATSALTANAEEVSRLMAVSGLEAEAADNLAGTFNILGSSTGSLSVALFRLSAELDTGGENLFRLGVSIRDSHDQLKTEGALLLEVRDRISQLGTAAERSAALTELFGRAGRQLAPIFALSRAEFEKWQQTAGDISKWTAEAQASTEQYQRKVNELNARFDALWQRIGLIILPGLTKLTEDLNNLTKNPWNVLFNVEMPDRLGVVILKEVEALGRAAGERFGQAMANAIRDLGAEGIARAIAFATSRQTDPKVAAAAAQAAVEAAEKANNEALERSSNLRKKLDKDKLIEFEGNLNRELQAARDNASKQQALAQQSAALRTATEENATRSQMGAIQALATAQRKFDKEMYDEQKLQGANAEKLATMKADAASKQMGFMVQLVNLTTQLSLAEEKTSAATKELNASSLPDFAKLAIIQDIPFENITVQLEAMENVFENLRGQIDPTHESLRIIWERIKALRDELAGGLKFDAFNDLIAVLHKVEEAAKLEGMTEAARTLYTATKPLTDAFNALVVAIFNMKGISVETRAALMAQAEAMLANGKATVEGTDATKKFNDELKRQYDELIRLGSEMPGAIKGLTDYEKVIVAATKQEVASQIALEQLRLTSGLTGQALADMLLRFKLFPDAIDPATGKLLELDAKQQALFDNIKKNLAATSVAGPQQAFANSLEAIGVQAELLGSDFDTMGARVAAAQAQFNAMIADVSLRGTPALAAAGQTLRDALASQRLGQDIERMFLSVSETFTKMADGMIAGTLDIADAFKNLGQSLLTNFVQTVIHGVFDPLLKAAAKFVTDFATTMLGISGTGGNSWGSMAAQAVKGFIGQVVGGTGGTQAYGTGTMLGPPSPGGGGFDIIGGTIGGIRGVYTAIVELPQLLTAVEAAWTTFNASLALGEGTITALTSGWNAFSGVAAETLGLVSKFLGPTLAAVAALYELYNSITAISEGRLGAGIGGLVGIAVGGIIGAVIANIPGALIGAAIGGFAGGQLGGLFDEDWEMIRKQRANQRTRTSLLAVQETSGRVLGAREQPSSAAFIDTLRQPMIGTSSSTGDVLKRIAELAAPGGANITFEGGVEFTLPEGMANRISEELGKAGFTGAEFSSGRVGSITEMIAATGGERNIEAGIKTWQKLMAGLDAIIRGMQVVDLTGLKLPEALTVVQAQDTAKSFNLIAEALGVAKQAVPDFITAVTGISKDKLQPTLDALLANMKEGLITALMAEPIKMTGLLDIGSLQKDGEDAKATIQRLAEALGGLGQQMDNLKLESLVLQDAIDAPTLFAIGLQKIYQAMTEAQKVLTTSRDPSEMFAAAQQLEALIKEKFKLEVETVTALRDKYRELAGIVMNSVAAIANAGDMLTQMGISISGMTAATAGFVMGMDDAELQLQTFPALVAAAFAEAGQAVAATGSPQAGLDIVLGAPVEALRDTFTEVMEILDPSARASALQAFLGQINSFFQEAVNGIKTYYAAARQEAERLADAAIKGIRDAATAQIEPLLAVKEQAQAGLELLNEQREAVQEHIAGIREALALQVEALNTQKEGLQEQIEFIREALKVRVDALNEEKEAIQDALEDYVKPLQKEREEIQKTLKIRLKALTDEREAIQDVLKVRVDALEDERDLIQKTLSAQMKALTDEHDALEKILDVAQKAAQIAKGLRDTLKDLAIGDLAPPDAQAQFAAARAAFQAAAPEEAGAAGKTLLDTALKTGLMTRPDPEFRALWAEVTARLQSMALGQEALASPEQATLMRLEAIEALSKSLNDTAEARLTVIADELDSLRDVAEMQLEAIEIQIESLQDAATERLDVIDGLLEVANEIASTRLEEIADEIKSLNKQAEAYLKPLEQGVKDIDTAIKTLNKEAKLALAPLEASLKSIDIETRDLNKSIKIIDKSIAGINKQADADVKAVEEKREAYLKQLSLDEQTAINMVKDTLAPIAWATVQAVADTSSLVSGEAALTRLAMMQLTHGMPYEEFIADRTRAMADSLAVLSSQIYQSLDTLVRGRLDTLIGATGGDPTAIRTALDAAGVGKLVTNTYDAAFNTAALVWGTFQQRVPWRTPQFPSAERGMDYVPRTGPVLLHKGERVLTAEENKGYGQNGGGGIQVTMNIYGVDDPKKIVDELEDELIRRARMKQRLYQAFNPR